MGGEQGVTVLTRSGKAELMRTPACGVRVLWLQWANSHRLQKSSGGKGTAWPLSK